MARGPLLFARHAYPPNSLGYCGPDDHRALLEYASAGVVDRGLVEMERRFDGAWPYLELIAAASGIDDPLDERVVEAYWIGNGLLENVSPRAMGDHLSERFRRRAGHNWDEIAELIRRGGLPHHSFHVFGVYPWVGLLRAGFTERSLEVIDRCRIRWGRVLSITGDHVTVRSRLLTWDGQALRLGPEQVEEARVSDDGYGTLRTIPEGGWVSLHWDWVCSHLTTRQLRSLRHYSMRHLRLVNRAAPSADEIPSPLR